MKDMKKKLLLFAENSCPDRNIQNVFRLVRINTAEILTMHLAIRHTKVN